MDSRAELTTVQYHARTLLLLVSLSLLPNTTGCARPCMGTPWGIYNACGCNPRDEAFITRVLSLGIPNIALDEVRRCANGDLSLGGAQSQNIALSTKFCIEKSQKIDQQSRFRILAELDVADIESNQRPYDCENWRKCYAKKTGTSADEAELRTAKSHIREMEDKVRQLEAEKALLQKNLASANLVITEDEKQIRAKDAELATVRAGISTMRTELDLVQGNNTSLKAKLEQAQLQAKKLEETKLILEQLAKSRQATILLNQKKIALLEEEAQIGKNSMSALCRRLDKDLGMPEVCTALEKGLPTS